MLADLRGLFECSTWFALYESLVYDTLCDNVDALSLIAFTQFFVVLFAFVVVTCRVVIYQTPKSLGQPQQKATHPKRLVKKNQAQSLALILATPRTEERARLNHLPSLGLTIPVMRLHGKK